MVKRIRAISQDRWNEIFEAGCNEGEQLFIDFDQTVQIGKSIPFSLSGSQAALVYYNKAVIENLKANTPFLSSFASMKSLPKATGKTFQMYSYPVE